MKKYYFIFLIFLSLDQFSKIAVRKIYLHTGKGSYQVLGDFFRITLTQNSGAVFGISLGMGHLNQMIFILASVVAICIIIYLLLKNSHPLGEWGFTLILSGAVGNLIDRIVFGSVTDFLDFDFPDFIMPRWYIFNIADSCIVIGVIILMIYYLFVEKSVSVKNESLERK